MSFRVDNFGNKKSYRSNFNNGYTNEQQNRSLIPRLEVDRLIRIVYSRIPEDKKLEFLEGIDNFLSKYYQSARMKPIAPTLAKRYKRIKDFFNK